MAAVTLKDLMDPLTKIEKLSAELNDNVDELIEVVIKGHTSAADLGSQIIDELKAHTDYLRSIASGAGNVTEMAQSKYSSQREQNIGEAKEASEVLSTLGIGAKTSAKALMLWMIVPKKAIQKFLLFVKQTFEILGKYDATEVGKNAKVLTVMGEGILIFSKSLALSALLLIPGMIAIPFLITTMFTMGLTISLLGKFKNPIQKGSSALESMGGGLLKFAIGLASASVASLFILIKPVLLFTMVSAIVLISTAIAGIGLIRRQIRGGSRVMGEMGIDLVKFSIGLASFALTSYIVLSKPKLLVAMAASLILLGGAVSFLGLLSRPIRKGSWAITLMGIGLGVFSVSYLIFFAATKDVKFKDIGIQSALLVALGTTFGVAGLMSRVINKGSLAITLMGFGLAVFSVSYLIFAAATNKITFKDIGLQAALLVSLGTTFGLAGLASVFIAAGGLAYAAVGAGLLLLSIGLAAFKKLDFNKKDAENLAVSLAGVRLAFLGSEEGGSGFFKKVGNLFKNAVDSGAMIAAAAGFIAAGISLILLSQGLKSFKKIEWSTKDSEKMGLMLGGITAAFSQAGGEPANPGGYFGKIFGNTFSPNAVERGITSVMGAGKALSKIAIGLKDFQSLVDSNVNFGVPDENGNYSKGTLGYAVVNTIGFIRQAFAAVASEGNVAGGGFFGTLFNIRRNKVEEGIRSVKGVGDELTNIVTGLKSFQELVESKINWDTLEQSIRKSITFVGEAFASIGIGKNEVKKGIKAVRGAGDELSKIAQGLITFKDLKSPDEVAKGIEKIFTSIGNTFTLYYDKPEFKGNLDHMRGFITELSEKADDGLLHEAADGMAKIAKAINSIDTNKAEAFADLFKGAGDLSRNRRAYEELIDAVGQIKDLFSSISTQTQTEGGEVITTLAPAPDPALQITLRNLNRAIGQMNGTLAQLPGDIQSIKIVIPE